MTLEFITAPELQPFQHGCGFFGPDRDAGEPGEAQYLVVV